MFLNAQALLHDFNGDFKKHNEFTTKKQLIYPKVGLLWNMLRKFYESTVNQNSKILY